MVQLEPGSLVHYQSSRSLPPSWPAVVCTDDMAPEDMLQTRPYGNISVTLVLVLGNLNFRWATPRELSEYDPFVPFSQEAMVERSPGLGDAYEMANNALESGLDLNYWRERMGSPGSVSGWDSDIEDSSDPELQQALRKSKEEYANKNRMGKENIRRGLFATSDSPPRSLGNADVRHTVASQKFTTPFGSSLLNVDTPLPNNTVDLTGEHDSKAKNSANIKIFQPPSFLDAKSLVKSLNEPTSDTVDGELAQSKQFVKVRVGPTKEVRMLQQQAVWNRPYFLDPRRGLNHFDWIDDAWELAHPALSDIEPKDFDFAAEFLESDGFGIRAPHDREATINALTQCYSAWSVADQLNMHDFMEHIVDKLEQVIEPNMAWILTFAIQVYGKPESVDLPAHYRLKEYLATYMANNQSNYIRDDLLRPMFIDSLELLPEMDRDVCEKRLQALDEQLDESDDETEDEKSRGDMELD